MTSYKKYLFLDRDGTLIQEPSDYQIDNIEKFKLLPDVIPSLLTLQEAGYHFVMVTNQDGLGTDSYPHPKFEMIQELLLRIFESQGIRFEAIRVCPHFLKDGCFCRKPQVGLVRDYMAMPELDRNRSFVIGDRTTDLVLAENMGLPGIQIGMDIGWKQIVQKLLFLPRRGVSIRKTRETEINVQVDLNQVTTTSPSDSSVISTGIGFFDHMLEQLSHHGGLGMSVKVKGDLHIDDHHTVEDTAIALGDALRKALGDKVGIGRYGFYLPMDEALTQVALDLSGRSYFRFEGKFSRELIHGMATEMIPHFFKSFSDSLGATLHVKVEGENTHHQIESVFKAVGRSLRSAIQFSDPGAMPSTKGVL